LGWTTAKTFVTLVGMKADKSAVAARRLSAALAACCLMAASPALARPSARELSRARAHFQQGTELEAAGNWTQALTLFRDVGQVKMTPQVRFHIALCEEHLGRYTSALGGYRLALEDAGRVHAASFKTTVTQHVQDLESRIPKLTVTRGKGAAGATIQLDGVELGISSIGTPIAVDPGPHTLTAKAIGYQPFEKTFDIEEKQKQTLEVDLQAAPSTAPELSSTSSGSSSDQLGAQPKPHSKVVAYVVGGVGIAGLGASGVFYYLRQKSISDLDSACGADHQHCPASSKSTYDAAKRYNILAPVALGVGVAGVGTAIVLLVAGHHSNTDKADHAGLSLEPAAPASDAGMSLVGKF
jgi:PEGA domain